MQQYFIDQTIKVQDEVLFNKEQAHHISHVMRMKENDVIRIADYKGHMFFAHLLFKNGDVSCIIDEEIQDCTKNLVSITLAQGLIKKEKWDFLLQKCGELGVDEIVPFTSSRTVVKTKDEKQDKKLQRWNKILLEACEQCKRSTLVNLHEPVPFSKLVKKSEDYDVKLIAYENAEVKSFHIKDVLKSYPNAKKVFVCVGCEGGFSEEEVVELEQHGFQRISLGGRILRAETAAMVVTHAISFYYEMLGDHNETH